MVNINNRFGVLKKLKKIDLKEVKSKEIICVRYIPLDAMNETSTQGTYPLKLEFITFNRAIDLLYSPRQHHQQATINEFRTFMIFQEEHVGCIFLAGYEFLLLQLK